MYEGGDMQKGAVVALEEAQRILSQTRQLLRDEEASAYALFGDTSSSDPAGLLVNSEQWLEVKAFGRELDAIQRLLNAMLERARKPQAHWRSLVSDAVPSDATRSWAQPEPPRQSSASR